MSIEKISLLFKISRPDHFIKHLFIIPGIFFAIRLSLVPFILVDKSDLSMMDAIDMSYYKTKGKEDIPEIIGITGGILSIYSKVQTYVGYFLLSVFVQIKRENINETSDKLEIKNPNLTNSNMTRFKVA